MTPKVMKKRWLYGADGPGKQAARLVRYAEKMINFICKKIFDHMQTKPACFHHPRPTQWTGSLPYNLNPIQVCYPIKRDRMLF